MFSSAARIARRTGAYGTPRKEYFVELIEEFGSTKSAEHRAQVVAHLANFAYDPINYSLLLALNVPELFVDASRKDKEPEMSAAAMQGIANLSADPDFQERLVAAGALDAISAAIVGESARVGTGEGPDAKAQGAEDLLLAALASAYFLAAGSERHASGLLSTALLEALARLQRAHPNTQVQHTAQLAREAIQRSVSGLGE